MSDADLIASALRDLAGQAVTQPPATDAIWRAGQRRRRRNVITISATAAGAAVVAAVLAFTLGGLGTPARHGGGLGPTGATGPVALHTPILFEQVAGVSRPPCAAGAHLMPASGGAPSACIRFTATRMSITWLESARVQRVPGSHEYQIDIRLTPADARRFGTLTRELVGQHSPRNQLAIVTNGHVLAVPVVLAATTAGQAAIPGFPSRPQAEFFLITLQGDGAQTATPGS